MPPRLLLLLALLQALGGCHPARFAFTTPAPRPVAADSLATTAAPALLPVAARRALSALAAAAEAARSARRLHQTRRAPAHRPAQLVPRPRLVAPADTVPRRSYIVEERRARRRQLSFWGKVDYFLWGTLLGVVGLLAFVGAFAWLVVTTFKFALSLEGFVFVLGGVPLIFLAGLLCISIVGAILYAFAYWFPR